MFPQIFRNLNIALNEHGREGFLAYYSYLYLVILNNKRQSGQNGVILYHETIYITYNVGKVVIWASHPKIIAFSKPNNGKYDNNF